MSFNVIDCFSGAGGFALGIRNAGFTLKYAFDHDPDSVATYRRNLGFAEVLDVVAVSGADLLRRSDMKQCDLLIGGPPCQGFSRQRRGNTSWDPRNELVLEFSRLIDEIRPRAFVMENVPAILGPRGNETMKRFYERVHGAAFGSAVAILDAADFGVPQHRKRAFLFGWDPLRCDTISIPLPSHNASNWLTVAEAFAGLPPPLKQQIAAVENHELGNISELNRERISFVPAGGGRADIPEHLRLPCHAISVEKAGHRGVYGRLSWDSPAGTITTKCNSFTRGRFAHPSENRNITMREAARLQSFPDSFGFVGDRVSVAHQIGNAVPPLLAEGVGKMVKKALVMQSQKPSADTARLRQLELGM